MISLPVIHRDVDEEERRFELKPLSGQFVDAVLEHEFEEKGHHDTQLRASRTALVGGLLLMIPGLCIDLWSGNWTSHAFVIALVRIATTAPLVAYGWSTRSRSRGMDESFDHARWVLLEGIVLAGFLLILAMRPSTLHAETATFCLIIVAFHLMAPNRVVLLAPLTAASCICFELIRMKSGGLIHVDQALELLTVTVTFACAVYFNRQLEQIRREEFVTLTIVTEYSDRLQKAFQRAQDLENELRNQAHLDPLTALNNRRWLFTEFDREFARARRTRRPLSVMILDADHFKQINDTYGHGCGDEVLCMLARVLSQTVRNTDALARIGGEEFAVMMPETDATAARELAERIRAQVASTKVFTMDHTIQLTISCGVTECHVDTEQPGDALKRADKGLYEAKHRGRDLVITR